MTHNWAAGLGTCFCLADTEPANHYETPLDIDEHSKERTLSMLAFRYVRLILTAALFALMLTALDHAMRLDVAANTQQQERQLEISMPKHVPLEIKLRKENEGAFKDLANENWARDFELEVTNTGDKPIYSLAFMIYLDVNAAAGFRILTPVSFGRVELSDHRVRAEADDLPIKAGESWTLRIDPGQGEVWARARRDEDRPLPKNARLQFKNLSFGDGTGLMGTAGTPVPKKSSQAWTQSQRPGPD